ncbi:MAG TPA: SH3 domain-containing protein [Candidatus Cottocaccamicrobium excrementipullorum]|nr:SH3 domain-containing protein [Candidatus Cottocaccamicrobium excrementipullorum]
MLDNKDYMSRLNRARRRRRGGPDKRIILAAVGIFLLLVLAAGAVYYFRTRPEVPAAADSRDSQQQDADAAAQEAQARAAAEEAAAKEEEEIQAVLDSYENLGLVQVSGYLNIRETPASDGRIIGKLLGDSACEILGQEGDWYHITSGGIEGYISSQYVLTGEEAVQAARPNVKLRAIVTADKLNIRSEPVLDPSNVIGQVLENERYEVISQIDGWVEIPSGYVSADYVNVQYALNEARELDLVTMALSQYDHLVISKVNNYLNVRAEPSTDGEIIGKMTSKAAGEILETLDGWYKIKSGNITGYITADPQYTAVGQEASDLAVSTASLMAIVNTDRLNVRTEPSTDATIWTQISKEERYPVISQLDGWVQIELDSDDGDGEADLAYISTRDNNVEVRYALPEAIKFSPLEEAAQASASLRTRIVNYALQFVGNPYVWGGTSLTNGVDCSGFTMQVMRNFGISLPHYSGSQARMGKAVSSSEMRPGDLIFYANSSGTVNHVAMYIGNGQIVHAASRRSGIKISTWNYRTPKTIRNMLGD